MKVAGACIAWNRPDYLRQTLESFSKNDLSDFSEMFFGIEPGGSEEVVKIANSIDFLKPNVHINPTRLTMRGNGSGVLDRVFDAGYDYCLYMEDDVLISPDATRLLRWFWNQNLEEYPVLALHNGHKRKNLDPTMVYADGGFHIMAFGISKEAWINDLREVWNTSKLLPSAGINKWIREHPKFRIATPLLGRCYHIGRFGGVHYRAKVHDRIYVDIAWQQEDKIFDYQFYNVPYPTSWED